MNACATCTSWAITASPLRAANMAPCAHGYRWTHLPPTASCDRYSALEPVLFAKRTTWLANITNKHNFGATK